MKIFDQKTNVLGIDMNPRCGAQYEVPVGMTEKCMTEVINEFIELAKSKKLTTRQIQYIFTVCSDRVLDFTFD